MEKNTTVTTQKRVAKQKYHRFDIVETLLPSNFLRKKNSQHLAPTSSSITEAAQLHSIADWHQRRGEDGKRIPTWHRGTDALDL